MVRRSPKVAEEAAERRWRRVKAPELVALVRAGATFVNGKLVERTDEESAADHQHPFHNY